MSRRTFARLASLLLVSSACAQSSVAPSSDASTDPTGAADAATASADADVRGGLGDACEGHGDCASTICYREDPDDPMGVCATECTGICPAGYACQVVSIGPFTDARVCVPAKDTMCLRCELNADCGDSSDFCVALTGGRFCTIDCASDPNVCPVGFTCQIVAGTGDTVTGHQCMPTNGICCVDADGDLRGVGDGCLGPDCDDTNPAIYDDADEICDGYDNNCDGNLDVDPIDCASPSCGFSQLGYFERAAEPCVDATCVEQPVVLCGLYTCAGGGEQGDQCATSCDGEDHTRCVPGAHCDEPQCQPDRPDGQACTKGFQCVSKHCQNGFCCSGGDCCQVAQDCPSFGTFDPVCDNPATCQGTRGEAVCQANFVCGTTGMVQDDSACSPATVANQCGWYLPIYCTGEVDQTPPQCPTSCASHGDCDAGGHCDPGTSTCVENLSDGQACGVDSDRCKSGHCQNGFCCAGGDCCSSALDCPAGYSSPPVCTQPGACQGEKSSATCVTSQCGTQPQVPDDSACTPDVQASNCGFYLPTYCTGAVDQTPPQCKTSCDSHADCDPNAYCSAGGACVPDEPDGNACADDAACQSGHCQNGFCCASGDCCGGHSHCAAYGSPPACTSPSTCQGQRTDGRCSGSFQCFGQSADDDSGCAGLLADDCGPYPNLYCTGAIDQDPPVCTTSCATPADCDPGHYCSAGGECKPLVDQGGSCTVTSQCQSGLACADGVCCDSACTGTCRACNLPGSLGTCLDVPNGQDPDLECPGFSCDGHYWGWSGSTCHRRSDVSDAAATCNGAGACHTAASLCPVQGQGPATATCNASCQDPTGGTCAGTTPGSCTNLNLGTETCGQGVCQVTQPICVNGAPTAACQPDWSKQTAEVCNGLDDNCNGQVDENLTRGCSTACESGIEFCTAGVWGGCTARQPTPEVCNLIDDNCNGLIDDGFWGDPSNGNVDFPNSWYGPTLANYPATKTGQVLGRILPHHDVDWFSFYALEDKNDPFCVITGDTPIKGRFRITAPPGVSYTVCGCWTRVTHCDRSSHVCRTATNGGTSTYATVTMTGMSCGSDDWGYLDLEVKPVGANDLSCTNYRIDWEIWE